LLYSDVKTGAFSAPQGKTGRFDKLQRGLGSELRAFLIKPHQHSQTALLDTIVRLHGDGAASRSIVEKLCRATLRMMNTRLSRNRRPRGPSAVKSDRALIWACLLLIGCDCLIAYEDRGDEGEIPGTFAARVDEMLRSFSIAIASKVSDPFHGQWSNLRRLFAKHANAEGRAAFSQLMSEIPESVAAIDQDGRQWLSKMEAMIHAQRRVKRSYEPSPAQRLSDIMPDPGNGTRQWETLHTILGNERTIGQLKQRFASENHAPPILLHGPRGTGKHTIARAYARTFLCYNREAGSDQPCGHCAPCTDLAHDHGFIDFNASADLDGARGREVSRRIGAGLYPHRRVVIIQNAGPREETLDALLSKLESFASDTAILLCMPDIAVVEPAITSRCAIYRVRPLVEKHASALIYRLMPALGARVPEASAVALMVTQSEGNPERIHALAQRAAVARATSLSQMRIAIDGGWSEWSMNLWSALVSQTARAAPIPPLPAEKSSAEAFSHAANGLVMLQREEMPSTPKRIFDEALNEKRRTTLVKLRDLAEQMGVPQDELWCRLAFIWTSDAHASSADFKEAIKATMRLLHPQFV
jgi:DNA polymerase III delta prime subunit